MTEMSSRAYSALALVDEWSPHTPVPLDGTLERNQYPPLLTAFLGLFLAFILFQLVISPIVTLVLLVGGGVQVRDLLGLLGSVIEEHSTELLTANSVGQIFGLALPAWVFARLHTSRPASFLRLRRPEASLLGLSVLGLAALMPLVQWSGRVNEQIPLPEPIRVFEASQIELIEKVLMTQTSVVFNLLMLAIVPAICEELLFRGYAQRQAERALGVLGGLLLSGIVFGLYHLRLSQVIPLSLLGTYLAFVAWRTGSLWPAMVVHFLNNAFAVALGAYVSSKPGMNQRDLDNMDIPWYFVAGGILMFAGVIVAMQQRARRMLAQQPRGGLAVEHD